MALLKLKKRSSADDPSPEATAQVVAAPGSGDPDGPPTAGKGRPTPKRSDARAARNRAGARGPAGSGKEARARDRGARRRASQEHRAAMMSGEISKLPPRERAPERVLARDFVDGRINIGPLFLIAAAIYFIGGIVPNDYVRMVATYVMLLGILAVVVDAVVLSRQVGTRVAERYPDSRVRVRVYSIQRSLLPRRWRLPRPRVSRADQRS
jgi:hypothetical protein